MIIRRGWRGAQGLLNPLPGAPSFSVLQLDTDLYGHYDGTKTYGSIKYRGYTTSLTSVGTKQFTCKK